MTANENDARAALAWIVGVLRELGVPFQITGGVAARCYGAKADLVAYKRRLARTVDRQDLLALGLPP